MQVTIDLRPMFSYSLIFIIISILVFLSLLIIYKKKNKRAIKKIPEKDIEIIRKEYLTKINNLLQEVDSSKIDNRTAYQNLSILIRNFIYKVTNLNVQNYTLEEIKKINLPILSTLVSEYYDPEFSKLSKGNIRESIKKTREVIEKWN